MKELKIEKLSDLGVGIAYDGEDEVYIKNALVGETVLTQIKDYFVKGSKRREGVAVKIISPSPDRAQVFCRHFFECGSCHIQHLNTKAQHELKIRAIKDALSDLKLDDKIADTLLGADRADTKDPYRNKSIRKFALQQGQIICGFYEPYSHKVLAVDICSVEPLWFSAICSDLCQAFCQHKIEIYDETEHTGTVREILLRESGEQRLVMLYVTKDESAELDNILYAMQQKYHLDVVALSVRPQRDNSLNRGKIRYLGSKKHIRASILDFTFNIGVNTFMQVNDRAMDKMYKEVIDFVSCAKNKDKALDLCCGVGTMTLPLARHFKEVCGVEIVQSSIDAAKENAVLNHIENVSFVCADMADYLLHNVGDDVGAIIADPSRVGLKEQSCKAICALKQPLHLALIFCSLKACERDLPHFIKSGFKVHKIIGVDMFEHSMHVETVCLLERL